MCFYTDRHFIYVCFCFLYKFASVCTWKQIKGLFIFDKLQKMVEKIACVYGSMNKLPKNMHNILSSLTKATILEKYSNIYI